MAPRIHRWFGVDGEQWACGVYDHGPMCRLCKRVDDAFAKRLEALARGELQVQIRNDGAFVFSDGAVCPEGST